MSTVHVLDGRTDGGTDQRTNQRTDQVTNDKHSHRDVRKHLKNIFESMAICDEAAFPHQRERALTWLPFNQSVCPSLRQTGLEEKTRQSVNQSRSVHSLDQSSLGSRNRPASSSDPLSNHTSSFSVIALVLVSLCRTFHPFVHPGINASVYSTE